MKTCSKKKIIIASLILLFLLSNLVNAMNDNSNSINHKIESSVKLDYAKKIANMKIKELNYSNDFIIENVDVIKDDKFEDLFFVFRLIPRGYIIISSSLWLLR